MWGDLLPMLERLFPVKFSAASWRAGEGAGELATERPEECVQRQGNGPISSLRVPHYTESTPESERPYGTVTFSDDPNVPFPFQGRSLQARLAVEPKILSLSGDEQALAFTDRGPVWSVSDRAGVKHFKSGFALPAIGPSECLRDVLNEERFLEMLPLLHWIREVCASTAYENPPLGACFIFDDPNLHWKRYGFVDFSQIAEEAARENYHVSFATIPLDSWYTHQATAELFRRNTKRISLAIHGNNHLRCELARHYTQSEQTSLLSQAIRRIERLERAAGVKVSRVMIPPHGACSEEMLARLVECGFDGACISHDSLRAHNATKEWTRALGYLSSEMVESCPVLPRRALNGDSMNAILLAAFLKQHVILRAHHQDLRDGVEVLNQHARLINSLGPVSWLNLAGLNRTNYQWRLEGTTCRLKPIARRVTFQMPEQATGLIVESCRNDSGSSWQLLGANGTVLVVRAEEYVLLPQELTGPISVQLITEPPLPVKSRSAGLARLAIFRRLLTEGRDRLLYNAM
jgi:hypothetical protein